MTKRHIGGTVDYRVLAQLHRPTDPEALRREARRLASQGLSPQDIGQAIHLAPAAVAELLRDPEPNHQHERTHHASQCR